MPNTQLLVRLRDLHEELASINNDLDTKEEVDEDTIDALGQLVTDMGALVDRAKESIPVDVPPLHENHILLDRVMKFDSKHPRVVDFLSQTTDLLAMMGI